LGHKANATHWHWLPQRHTEKRDVVEVAVLQHQVDEGLFSQEGVKRAKITVLFLCGEGICGGEDAFSFHHSPKFMRFCSGARARQGRARALGGKKSLGGVLTVHPAAAGSHI
jgi:hypothetical protein